MDPAALFEQAKQLHLAGRFAEAGRIYDRVLELAPDHPETMHLRGAVSLQLQQYADAVQWFDRTIAAAPHHASAYANLATAYLALGMTDKAADAADRALALNPSSMAAIVTKATAAHDRERYAEALAASEAGLARDPRHVELLHIRASALGVLGRRDEALETWDRAIALARSARAYAQRGELLFEMARAPEAIVSCDRAIVLDPTLAPAHVARAHALAQALRLEEAIAAYDRAIALMGDVPKILAERGAVFQRLKRFDEALGDFDKASALDPELRLMLGDALYLSLRLCRWEGLESRVARLLREIDVGAFVTAPFITSIIAASPEQQAMAAAIYFEHAIRPHFSASPIPSPAMSGKLRLGYFSSDFRDHPVGHIALDLFNKHDRSRFEIVAFALDTDGDNPMRQRIAGTVDTFVEASRMSDADVTERARDLGIHIAIDLNGHTAGARTGIFAVGTAPIQVNFLGYPGTMSAPCHHYIVGDRHIIPRANYSHFSERVVTMPHTYLVTNDAKRHLPTRIFTQRELGLPDDGFVFCSFNGSFKFTPEIFDIWMRLLKAVPDSVLWLAEEGVSTTKNLRAEARKRGVAPERLIFAPRLPGLDYLARFRSADLFLDTFHYNAHSTASDALLVGLPLLTRRGNTFASRVAASLLTTIGLPELIAETSAEYERMALLLATEPATLAAIRDRLEENIATSPLFDSARYMHNLESAFTQMWQRHATGLPPDHLAISDD